MYTEPLNDSAKYNKKNYTKREKEDRAQSQILLINLIVCTCVWNIASNYNVCNILVSNYGGFMFNTHKWNTKPLHITTSFTSCLRLLLVFFPSNNLLPRIVADSSSVYYPHKSSISFFFVFSCSCTALHSSTQCDIYGADVQLMLFHFMCLGILIVIVIYYIYLQV